MRSVLACSLASIGFCAGFVPQDINCNGYHSFRSPSAFDCSSSGRLSLVPIRNFQGEFSFLSMPDSARCCLDSNGTFLDKSEGGTYELSLAEEKDLPDLSRFIVQVFGADVIRLSQDINAFERMLMKPAVELLNGYSGIVAFAEVLAGLRSRLSGRSKQTGLALPKLDGLNQEEKIIKASSEAAVLMLAKKHEGSDWHIDVIGSVELRLQPCDAKIPFTLPGLDRIERFAASLIGLEEKSRNLQPYLSNLCVDDAYRGKGIGRALVRCVENIAENWGYSKIYLHVDPQNTAAFGLYKSEGYRDVGRRWRPFWAGKASKIGYFVKNIVAARKGNMSR
jgi:GNAT superfamily N-acetyltransferase